MKIKFIGKGKVILGCVALALLLCPTLVSANQQNVNIKVPTDTMKDPDNANNPINIGAGFVQVVKGSPSNPPTGIANDTQPAFSGSDAYAVAQQAPYLGQDIKGTVGKFVPEVAGNGGFYLSNVLDHNLGTSYYVRYWTPTGDWYGNSNTVIPWASGLPVPADMTFNSFTLYKASSPPTPTDVQKEITGYTANPVTLNPDKPIVTLTMVVDLTSYQVTKYEFKVQKIDSVTKANIGDPVVVASSGIVLQDKDHFSLNSSYKIQARAINNFNADPAWGPAVPVQLDIGGIAGGTINVDYTLSAGLNQFALFVDPDKGDFKVNDQSLSNSLDNFIQNIKTKNPAVELNTFGWWDSAAKKPVGYIILWDGLTPAYKPVNGAPDATKTKLIKDKVYQVAVGDTFIFTISGTR